MTDDRVDATSLSRRRGALLGMACGDALGTTLEFRSPSAPPFPTLAASPHTEVIGGGPFAVAPGQVTDDTQMACCLAASLGERGRFDAVDVGRRYVEWWRHAFDIGALTRDALAALEGGDPAAGRSVWQASGRRAAGNGSLMRTTPIAVAFAVDEEARRRASLEDSAITHFDPRCRLACAAFNSAIASALLGDEDQRSLFAAAEQELAASSSLLLDDGSDRVEIEAAAIALVEDLDCARRDDPQLYGPSLHLHQQQGFVRVAFRLAFWELAHAPTFEAALVDVVNRGGDADTNGAITGALLGAHYGEESIPARWRDRVLGALSDQPGALRDRYHPRQLLEMIGRIGASGSFNGAG